MKDAYREHLRRATPPDLDADFERLSPRRRALPLAAALAAALLLLVVGSLASGPEPTTHLFVQVEGKAPVELELTLETP